MNLQKRQNAKFTSRNLLPFLALLKKFTPGCVAQN